MKCPKCNGTGIDDDRLICYECDGTGEYEPFDADVELDKLDDDIKPKLKPCPFCGSNNVELRRGFAFNGAVHCNNCTADVVFDAVGLVATGNENWQKACIDGWNKRVVAE